MKFRKFLLINIFIISIALSNVLFTLPSKISSGGFMSIALIIQQLLNIKSRSSFNVGIIAFSLNIPLLIYSFLFFDREYFYKTIYGTLALPSFVMIIDKIIKMNNIRVIPLDPYLASAAGAIIIGLGIGSVMSLGGSTGGTDIVAKIVNKYTKLSMGKATIMINFAIISLSCLTFGAQRATLSLFAIFLIGNIIDTVLKVKN